MRRLVVDGRPVSVDRARDLQRRASAAARRLDQRSEHVVVDEITAQLLSDAVAALDVVLSAVEAMPDASHPDDLDEAALDDVERDARVGVARAAGTGHAPSTRHASALAMVGEIRRRRG